MSLFGCGKALNEGFFHLLVIAFAVYLFVHGPDRLRRHPDVLVLFLNVMAPLNEIHRFIDEAHESSLRVGDLHRACSREPVDRSFQPGRPRRAAARRRASPCSSPTTSASIYRTPDGKLERALDGALAGDPPRRDDRRRRPLGLRQDDLAAAC